MKYIFYSTLSIAAEEQWVMHTEPLHNPKANREKLTEMLFETFNIKALNMASKSALSLYSAGITTGLILQSGGGLTCSAPMYDGCILPHAYMKIPVSGNHLTNYLSELLKNRGYSINSTSEWFLVNDMKEMMCHVSPSFDIELTTIDQDPKHIYCPMGVKLTLEVKEFIAPKHYFNLVNWERQQKVSTKSSIAHTNTVIWI